MPTRHTQNPNLTLWDASHFHDRPLMRGKGPYIQDYLSRLEQVIVDATTRYARVFAFRVDLHLPGSDDRYAKDAMPRFLASFKAKLAHHRDSGLRAGTYRHDSSLSYCWTREVGETAGNSHYHLLILLNGQAYNALGQFQLGQSNLYNRLVEAWASALRIAKEDAEMLMYLPKDGCYRIQQGDPAEIDRLFARCSYLCKADTKSYGRRLHSFATSRPLAA